MKRWLIIDGSINPILFAVMIVLPMVILSSTAMAAPTLSDTLRGKIAGEIASPIERESVLKNAAAAVRAGVHEEVIAPVIEKSLENGVGGVGIGEMLQVLAAASEKNLPLGPIAGKIMEGLAKNVGERSIIRALERVQERLELSVGLAEGLGVTGEKREELIIETAGAIAAGMDREALRHVYDAMAMGTSAGSLEPIQIMEMVKAASGYGADSRKVSKYAAALIENERHEEGDIIQLLRDLSGRAYEGISDNDPDDILERHIDNLSASDEEGADNATGEEQSDGGQSKGGSGSGEDDSEGSGGDPD
ncbi:MAG TPA: hypothetical protein ENH32_04450 [Proteobacteria bacterium]|nr:hypothetical protein [Pseudomonadota bacterium]